MIHRLPFTLSRKFKIGQVVNPSIYAFLMPFVHAFALTPQLPLPFLYLLLAAPAILSRKALIYKASDILLVITGVLGVLSATLSYGFTGSKNLSHTAAYFLSVFIYYFIGRTLIHDQDRLTKAVTVLNQALFLVSGLILTEFVSRNFLGLDFQALLPRPSAESAFDPTVFGVYFRPRGLAEEPGHMALFYDLAIPFSLFFARSWRSAKKLAYHSVNFLAYFLLFSSASIIALATGCLLAYLVTMRLTRRKLVRVMLSTVALLALAFSFEGPRLYVDEVVVGKAAEMLDQLSGRNLESSSDRGNRYTALTQLVTETPWGIGWGTASQVAVDGRSYNGVRIPEGFTSLYGEVLAAGGVGALMAFSLFMALKLSQAVRLARRDARHGAPLLASTVALSLHYSFVSNYWFPMLWFALAAIDISAIRGERKLRS